MKLGKVNWKKRKGLKWHFHLSFSKAQKLGNLYDRIEKERDETLESSDISK